MERHNNSGICMVCNTHFACNCDELIHDRAAEAAENRPAGSSDDVVTSGIGRLFEAIHAMPSGMAAQMNDMLTTFTYSLQEDREQRLDEGVKRIALMARRSPAVVEHIKRVKTLLKELFQITQSETNGVMFRRQHFGMDASMLQGMIDVLERLTISDDREKATP